MVIFDLEDSVAPAQKEAARSNLSNHLAEIGIYDLENASVRVNGITTPHFLGDLETVITRGIRTIVLPKIHSPNDLDHVSKSLETVLTNRRLDTDIKTINLIASIESARGVWFLDNIAKWKPNSDVNIRLSTLLFAAEDYCADTSVVRTKSSLELLFTRSKIVLAAAAYGLDSVDMVCTNYKDMGYLRDECTSGKQLGFTGKQAIHPGQVTTINQAFMPSEEEIFRAERILLKMNVARRLNQGAFGLDIPGSDGDKEMIDEPMLKQAIKTIHAARRR